MQPSGTMTWDEQAIEQSVESLKALILLLGRVASMTQIPDSLETFLIATRDPLLAMVLLFWMRDKLFDPDFYDWAALTQGELPPAFYLLDEMAAQHPSHQGLVFTVYRALFEHEFQVEPLVAVRTRTQTRFNSDNISWIVFCFFSKQDTFVLFSNICWIAPASLIILSLSISWIT